jgi:hypothetical protein
MLFVPSWSLLQSRAIASSFLFAKILIFRVPYPMGNGYENPGQNGNFTERKSNRVLTVLDTLIRPEPSPSAGKRPSISGAAEAVRDIRSLSRDIAGVVWLSLRILRSRASAPASQSSDESQSRTGYAELSGVVYVLISTGGPTDQSGQSFTSKWMTLPIYSLGTNCYFSLVIN